MAIKRMLIEAKKRQAKDLDSIKKCFGINEKLKIDAAFSLGNVLKNDKSKEEKRKNTQRPVPKIKSRRLDKKKPKNN